jgi:hypothetical protein
VNHYNNLLNENASTAVSDYDDKFKQFIQKEIINLEQTLSKSDDPVGILLEPFTTNEVANLCRCMPNHKSSGIDSLTYESLKYGGYKLYESLAKLFNAIKDFIHIPAPLKHSIIIPVHKGKKKPKDSVKSYRGISLSPVINKILEKAVLNRLKPWLTLHNFPPSQQQAGRGGTSSVSLSYTVQEIISSYTNRGSKVFAAFVGIQQAFDTLW